MPSPLSYLTDPSFSEELAKSCLESISLTLAEGYDPEEVAYIHIETHDAPTFWPGFPDGTPCQPTRPCCQFAALYSAVQVLDFLVGKGLFELAQWPKAKALLGTFRPDRRKDGERVH